MTKRNLITSLQGILAFTREIFELSGRNAHVEQTIEHLESPNIDLIVWNDINDNNLITEEGFYLMSDGKQTDKFYFDAKYWKNSQLPFNWSYVNSHFYPSKIIKWAKMPEYKS